ncbi:MAG: hypothetical protein ACRDP6_32325 [Actinoallomurus sp.]
MQLTIFTGPYRVGANIGGIGLRCWELACALSDAGVPVTLVCPPGSDTTWSRSHLAVVLFAEDTWRDIVEASTAVMTGAEADTRVILHAYRLGRPLIAETAVPVEHLDYDRLRNSADPTDVYGEVMDQYLLQVLTADHLLARSAVERAGLYATLATMGRLTPQQHERSRTLDHLVSLVPIGFAAAADRTLTSSPVTAEPVEFTWSGGIWDFYDTEPVCRALALLRDEGQPMRVRFLYAPPADQEVAEAARLTRIVDELGLQDLVLRYNGRLAHSERDGLMKATRALMCLGRPGVENQLCLRLRLRDVLLYRTPVIVDAHGASGDWVRRLGIGLAVDTREVRQVADAMTALASDNGLLTPCLHAIEAERSHHFFEANIGPLLDFLADRRRAADAGSPVQTEAIERILRRRPALAHDPLQLI